MHLPIAILLLVAWATRRRMAIAKCFQDLEHSSMLRIVTQKCQETIADEIRWGACRVCARYSRAYLRHLYASNELLAQVLNTVHNLAYYLDTMRKVRQAIILGEVANFLSGVRPPHLPPQSVQKRRGLGTPES